MSKNNFIEDLKSLEGTKVTIKTQEGKEITGVCTSIDYNTKDFFVEKENGSLVLIKNAVEVISEDA